jgi:hypothetical protein
LAWFGSNNFSVWQLNKQDFYMANIHFIGGEKGGVGKSLVARVLAQYFIDKEMPFLGFDSDRSHGALLRFYAGFASPVVMDRYETLDAIVEAAVEKPERRILVDLAAQTYDPLVKWMDESGVLELSGEAGFAIYYWHVMDAGKDSVDLLKKLLDRFESGAGRNSCGRRIPGRFREKIYASQQPSANLSTPHPNPLPVEGRGRSWRTLWRLILRV